VLTLIDVDGAEHRLAVEGGTVAAADLSAATGWELKPEGLCRGETCVPLLGHLVTSPDHPGRIDLRVWAEALGLLLVDAPEGEVAALVPSAATHSASRDGRAPSLTLPDVDGRSVSFDDLSGHKRVLVTWASWCGCRHELSGWERLQQELADSGLRLFSVALDADPEDARPWIEAARPSYPVVVDTAHVTAEKYDITNVPSVVWVDEDDRIVKPPTIAPGDDSFREYTKIDSSRHHDALRAWVATGQLPTSAERDPQPRTDDGQRALGERRIAAHLVRRGDTDRARVHLAAAQELAPWDWTVRRGGIALTGGDPFLGEEFLAFWEEWDGAGRPGYRPT
jgi:peroxiredoxin